VDRPSLRNVILRKLDDGTLPTKAPNKFYSAMEAVRRATPAATRSFAHRSSTS
jgi:hypothetical protein